MMSKHLRAYLIHAVCAAGEVAAALRDTTGSSEDAHLIAQLNSVATALVEGD